MAEFIVNRVPHGVSDILKTACDIENAKATLQLSQKSRMLLLEVADGDSVDGCDGQWRLFTKRSWKTMVFRWSFFELL